jgi:germination protein M
MKRSILTTAALAALLGTASVAAGCGGDDPVAVGPVPSEQEAPAASPAPPAAAPAPPAASPGAPGEPSEEAAETTTYEVWFALGDKLFVARRTQEATRRVGTAALEALLAGPSQDEAGASVTTAIPEDTQLLGLSVEDRVATVDLSSEFESGGGSLSMFLRLGQVVYTLTQFPTVDRVRFHLDGEPVDVFSGEGIVLDDPVTRKDYEDLLPIILVERPLVGERVASPLEIEGSANVFEANVTVRVLDARGRELARTFTTATCGTGCRGDFSVAVPFTVGSEQRGMLVVSDDDADGDGSPQHEVRIPVMLAPAP